MELIERVGAYVGLAGFVGLAILALLYFSQARDVRRLREWAGRAPERAGEAATQHYLPPTPIEEAGRKPRKPLGERIRSIHIPQLRYVALVVGGIVILGGAAFGALQIVGDDEPAATKSKRVDREREPRTGDSGGGNRAVRVDPAQVTVAVLNGTTIAGLAAQVGEEARADGFTLGTVTNAAKTNQAGSVVLYRKGEKNSADAVGDRLGIRSVQEVDPLSSELAGSFDVVVLVGADRSQ